jgi:hypothetical protein
MAWKPATRVDHVEVLGTCFSCHNGTTAKGKHAQHIPSTNSCGDCHQTSAWLPARFDHTNVVKGTCATCHDGQKATGKTPTHLPTTQSCDSCHTTIAWRPAKFDHLGVVPGTCATCHNGSQATGKNPGHFVTNRSCDYCHKGFVNWLGVTIPTFRHLSPNYPGDHGDLAGRPCAACHTSNAELVPYRFPTYKPFCAGCHFDKGSREHGTTINGTGRKNPNCAASGCHKVTSKSF